MEFLGQVRIHLETDASFLNQRDDLWRGRTAEEQQGHVVGTQGLIRRRGQKGKQPSESHQEYYQSCFLGHWTLILP
jgi:hypothetical protein